MSTDYYIMRGISKNDILNKTDIKVINHPDGGDKEFLEDKYGNVLHINPQMVGESKLDDENIRELTRYGGNNATYIMDTLVREFKMVYYSDDGFQNLCRPTEQSHDPDVDGNIKRDMMRTHGYDVINKDTIIIPSRTEKDYETNT
jgi:hypothetical protein